MTYEDVKRIRANPTAEEVDNKELHRMIDNAIEKQIPQKTKNDEYGIYLCPACGEFPDEDSSAWLKAYCCYCGQALDWSE